MESPGKRNKVTPLLFVIQEKSASYGQYWLHVFVESHEHDKSLNPVVYWRAKAYDKIMEMVQKIYYSLKQQKVKSCQGR